MVPGVAGGVEGRGHFVCDGGGFEEGVGMGILRYVFKIYTVRRLP